MRPFLLTFFVLVVAHHASALPPPSAVEAKRLIVQLGSNRYYEREAATKALQQLGKPVLPALRVACDSKDAEVRKRAWRLVEDLAPVQQVLWTSEPTIWVEMDVNIIKPNVVFLPVQKDVFIIRPKQRAKP